MGLVASGEEDPVWARAVALIPGAAIRHGVSRAVVVPFANQPLAALGIGSKAGASDLAGGRGQHCCRPGRSMELAQTLCRRMTKWLHWPRAAQRGAE